MVFPWMFDDFAELRSMKVLFLLSGIELMLHIIHPLPNYAGIACNVADAASHNA